MRRLRFAGRPRRADGNPATTTRGAAMGHAVSAGTRRALNMLAGLVSTVTGLVLLTIVLGIGFVVLKANPHNGLVNAVHDAASWLTQPFHDMFKPKGHKQRIAVNWGLAAVVYLVAGNVISRLLRR
jgi:hypothetical protein